MNEVVDIYLVQIQGTVGSQLWHSASVVTAVDRAAAHANGLARARELWGTVAEVTVTLTLLPRNWIKAIAAQKGYL